MREDLIGKRARAERIFKRKDAIKADGPKALQDYNAAQQAIIEWTRKLREQRLAREVASQRKDH